MSISNNRILSGGVPTTKEAVQILQKRVANATLSSASVRVSLGGGQHTVRTGELKVTSSSANGQRQKSK